MSTTTISSLGCHRVGLAIGIVEEKSILIGVAKFGSPGLPEKPVIAGLAFGEDFSMEKLIRLKIIPFINTSA
jgi:hypothetical protein